MEPQEAAADVPSIFLALQESALGAAMRESVFLYPAAEVIHIFGFVILVGSIIALDLRVLGVGRAVAVQPLARLVLPLSRVGFFLAIPMGFLLLSADAAHVVVNPAFRIKMLLLALALVNVAVAHAWPWRRLAAWTGEAPAAARATALLSLVLWLGVVCAGRLIAYF